MVKIAQFQPAACKYSIEAKLKVILCQGACRGLCGCILYTTMTCTVCVALVIRVWNRTAALMRQPGKRSHMMLPPKHVIFTQHLSPNHTLSATTALVCWFARKIAFVCFYPADQCRCVRGASGEGHCG